MLCKFSEGKICNGCMWCYDTDYNEKEVEEYDSDFDFSDYGYDGEGVIHVCHCVNCGADIEYRIRTDNQEDE